MARLDEFGHELLDDAPVSIPLRFRRVDSVAEDVRRLVREELSRVAASKGVETFEEADDFAVGDDYDPRSRYEIDDEDLFYDHRDEGGDDAASGSVDGGDREVREGVLRGGEEGEGGEVGAAEAERPAGAVSEPGTAETLIPKQKSRATPKK